MKENLMFLRKNIPLQQLYIYMLTLKQQKALFYVCSSKANNSKLKNIH